MRDSAGTTSGPDSLDAIAGDLQRLRMRSGEIPYAEIVRRIGKLRETRGVDPVIARPARTTVYDAFRTGRSRINVELVGEIALALGCSPTEAKQWEERCLRVRTQSVAREEPLQPSAPVQPVDQSVSVIESPDLPVADSVPIEVVQSEAQVETADVAPEPGLTNPRRRIPLLILLACLAMNVLGFWVVSLTGFPLYLDMVGTAVSAILYGPWIGAAVGLATNLIGLGITDESSAAFGLVNIAGAMVWGYGARAIRGSNVLTKFVLLNIAVALTCSLVASLLLVFIFNGVTGHGSEITMQSLLAKTNSLGLAVFNANIMFSLVDKLLSGFIALTLIGVLNSRTRTPLYQSIEEQTRSLFHRWDTQPTTVPRPFVDITKAR